MVEWVKGLMRYLVERKGDTVTDVGGSRERRWVTTVSCIDDGVEWYGIEEVDMRGGIVSKVRLCVNVESIEDENMKRVKEGREVYIVFPIGKAHCSSLEARWCGVHPGTWTPH